MPTHNTGTRSDIRVMAGTAGRPEEASDVSCMYDDDTGLGRRERDLDGRRLRADREPDPR